MNRIKVLSVAVLLLSSLTVFSGCGKKVEVIDEPKTTTFQGVLEKNDQGFFEVVTGTGERVKVSSTAINLGDSDYLGNLVSVIGVEQEDQSMELVGVSVLEILNPVKEKKLVEFYDSSFGIKLNYYDDWKVDSNEDAVVFTAPAHKNGEGNEFDKVIVEQIPFLYAPESPEDDTKEKALVGFAKKFYPEMVNPEGNINMIGVAPMPALKLLNEDVYFFYRNGLVYQFSYKPSVKNYNDTSKATFGEMLRSFQFIGINDHSNEFSDDLVTEDGGEVSDLSANFKLTSFESLPYHFKADFPASWYYSGSLKNENGVLHVYQFSDKPVDEGEILIEMSIVNRESPAGGSNVSLKNGSAKMIEANGEIEVYLERNGQRFEIIGNKSQKDLILVMAGSIREREIEE